MQKLGLAFHCDRSVVNAIAFWHYFKGPGLDHREREGYKFLYRTDFSEKNKRPDTTLKIIKTTYNTTRKIIKKKKFKIRKETRPKTSANKTETLFNALCSVGHLCNIILFFPVSKLKIFMELRYFSYILSKYIVLVLAEAVVTSLHYIFRRHRIVTIKIITSFMHFPSQKWLFN